MEPKEKTPEETQESSQSNDQSSGEETSDTDILMKSEQEISDIKSTHINFAAKHEDERIRELGTQKDLDNSNLSTHEDNSEDEN